MKNTENKRVSLKDKMVNDILQESKEFNDKLERELKSFFNYLEDLMLEKIDKGVWGGKVEFPIKDGKENGNEFVIISAEDNIYKFYVSHLINYAKKVGVKVSATSVIFSNEDEFESSDSGKSSKRKYGDEYIEFYVDFFNVAEATEVIKSKLLKKYYESKAVFYEQVKRTSKEIFNEEKFTDCFGRKAKYYKFGFPAYLTYSFFGERQNPIPNQEQYIDIVSDIAKKLGINITAVEKEGMYNSRISCELIIKEEKADDEIPYIDVLRKHIKEAHEKTIERRAAVQEKRKNIPDIFEEMLPIIEKKIDEIGSNNGVYVHFNKPDNPDYIWYDDKIQWELSGELRKYFTDKGYRMGCVSNKEQYIEYLVIYKLL